MFFRRRPILSSVVLHVLLIGSLTFLIAPLHHAEPAPPSVPITIRWTPQATALATPSPTNDEATSLQEAKPNPPARASSVRSEFLRAKAQLELELARPAKASVPTRELLSPAALPPSESKRYRTDEVHASTSVLPPMRPPVAPNPATTTARLVDEVAPVYPKSCRRHAHEGTVVLSLTISEKGTIQLVELKKSAGCVHLNRSAIAAARKLTYEPATADGLPVATVEQLRVRFSLQALLVNDNYN